MNYFLILSICSVIAFFLFNIHLNVFFLSVYLYMADIEEKSKTVVLNSQSLTSIGLSINNGLPRGPSSKRLKKVVKGERNPRVGYWEYLPAGYGYGKRWPLLIFFHGRGANGNGSPKDLDKILHLENATKGLFYDRWPLEESAAGDEFIYLSMQNDRNCPSPEYIDGFIRFAIEEYEVDIQRIYLTGLSCGAIGIWNYLRKYVEDDLVAAVVPLAGLGESAWDSKGCKLGKVPIWAFHGDVDGLTFWIAA